MNGRELIAARAAKFFKDGDLVNLGIGLPTMCTNYLPEGVEVLLQSENGFVGLGPAPADGEWDGYVCNAGGGPATILPEGSVFDSCMSFGLIRGGHVNATVLGALEVDQEGNLANWIIPGKMVPGMGGAMDLVSGANLVIVTTDHCDKKGNPKILKKCTLPLTAAHEVDYIVTELCVLHQTDKGLVLEEVAPGVTVEEVVSKTDAELIIPDQVGVMNV